MIKFLLDLKNKALEFISMFPIVEMEEKATPEIEAIVDGLFKRAFEGTTGLATLRKEETMSEERMFPIQRSNPVPWSMAQRAYNTYARLCGTGQSLERLAERGGFGLNEFACSFLGHDVCKCNHRQECVEKADTLGRHLTHLEDEVVRLKQEGDKEIARWQKAIYELCCKAVADGKLREARTIDGGGEDSGDPLDFSLAEISLAICSLQDEIDLLRRERDEARRKNETDTTDA